MNASSDEVINIDEDEELPLVDEDGNDLVSEQGEIPCTHMEDISEHAYYVPVDEEYVSKPLVS